MDTDLATLENPETNAAGDQPALIPMPRPQREISTDTRPLNYFADLRSFEVGQRQALMLSHSSIIPNQYRAEYPVTKNGNEQWIKNPDAVGNCFIALELASRLNTSPLVVMQQVDMIRGRPSLRGTFQAGLINGSGRFTELDYECNNADGDDYGYRCKATRLSDGKECIGPWVTWAMVKGEGWNTKSDSKWKTMPELMFQYRACSFWSRLFASHITLGLLETEEAREAFGDADTSQRTVPLTISGPDSKSILGDLQARLAEQAAGMEKPVAPVQKAEDTKGPFPDTTNDEPAPIPPATASLFEAE